MQVALIALKPLGYENLKEAAREKRVNTGALLGQYVREALPGKFIVAHSFAELGLPNILGWDPLDWETMRGFLLNLHRARRPAEPDYYLFVLFLRTIGNVNELSRQVYAALGSPGSITTVMLSAYGFAQEIPDFGVLDEATAWHFMLNYLSLFLAK